MRELDLQIAIVAALKASADLTTLGVGVYDHTPQDVDMPFVVVGEDFAVKADTDDTLDSDHTVTLHAWSNHRGQYEIKRIQQACYKALHRQTLTVNGAIFTDAQVQSTENFLDDDGLKRHGVQDVLILLDGVTP